jgi:hypothetical protein
VSVMVFSLSRNSFCPSGRELAPRRRGIEPEN